MKLSSQLVLYQALPEDTVASLREKNDRVETTTGEKSFVGNRPDNARFFVILPRFLRFSACSERY